MSEFKTDKIKPVDAGSTTTLGESGDTIATSSGTTLDIQGTYSGINAISWDTTAKTASFTAETNKGYFINTTSGEVTITLPATPVAGSFIGIKDYALTAQTNNILIAPNGNKIQGTTDTYRINTQGGSANLVYVDSTQGWLTFDAAQASDIAQVALFTTATGGTVTTCGDFKIHTFTSPGTFCVSQIGNSPTNPLGGPSNVDYLVIAGGGGGGGKINNGVGGGGAGGYRTTFPSPGCNAGSFPVSVTSFPITVGGGGAGGSGPSAGPTCRGSNGSDSVFSTITSTGGGFGGDGNEISPCRNGGPGGSGGGAGRLGTAGSGNTPPVSPSQGNNGGAGIDASDGAGGGGAGGAGAQGVANTNGGAGGAGSCSSIDGSSTGRSGGGGGGASNGATGGTASDGGGAGGSSPANDGTAGTANTGGGGGGAAQNAPSSGSGGSGIVIIRYRYQ